MANRNDDILQIKKYLEGKLDARAMYELERRALDDPFLMDAMEGYGAAGNGYKAPAQLAAVLQKRLQRPKTKIIPMRVLAMAASVVAVLGVGGWWFATRNQNAKTEVVAQAEADKTFVNPSPLVQEPEIIINKDSLIAANTSKTYLRPARRNAVAGKNIPVDEIPDMADETTYRSYAITTDNVVEEVSAKLSNNLRKDSVPLDEMLVVGYAAQRKRAAEQPVLSEVAISSSRVAAAPVPQSAIKGKVVSSEDGQPIAGVTVRAGNSANVAFTDKDGNYILNIDSANSNITYNYPGFQSRRLNGNDNALSNVSLQPENASLNEVVVAGTGAGPNPQPKNGWANYQKYLNANSISPDGKAKSYRVSFTVGSDGSLSNFKLDQAKNDVAGQKAIQLIKNGPEWVGNKAGESKKITVTVKFHKPEK